MTELHIPNPLSDARARNVGYSERMVSVVGGPALAVYGLLRGGPGGIALAFVGSGLFYRGLTGYCPVYNALDIDNAGGPSGALHVEKSVTINRSADELYRFWRDFTNLPRFMKHLQSVTVSDERHSHWVATAPAGSTATWDAEITEDRPNELIAWRSLAGAQVHNAGVVRFEPAAGERGTVVRVSLDYSPPAGALGAVVAKLFAEEPSQQVEGDLRRFRSIMEAGELPTTAGQPAGTRSSVGTLLQPASPPGQDAPAEAETEPPTKPLLPKKPPVQQASEDSFPASDPPAWTGTSAGGDEREVGG